MVCRQTRPSTTQKRRINAWHGRMVTLPAEAQNGDFQHRSTRAVATPTPEVGVTPNSQRVWINDVRNTVVFEDLATTFKKRMKGIVQSDRRIRTCTTASESDWSLFASAF